MAEFISLTCPTCGGRLKITGDMDRFACAHCGNEHLVKRGEGVISLVPIAESLKIIEGTTSKVADDIASMRLSEEIHRSENLLRSFFLSSEKQRSFVKEMRVSLQVIKKLSFFESFSVTPEEIIERLIALNASEFAKVVRLEAKVRSKTDERIKILDKLLELKAKAGGETLREIAHSDQVQQHGRVLLGRPPKSDISISSPPVMSRPLQLTFRGLGVIMLGLATYFLFNSNLFENATEMCFIVPMLGICGLGALSLATRGR